MPPPLQLHSGRAHSEPRRILNLRIPPLDHRFPPPPLTDDREIGGAEVARVDELADDGAEFAGGDDADAVAGFGVAVHADGDEERDERLAAAGGVVFREVADVALHLGDVRGLGGDAVLELDDEDEAVLEDDEVGAAAAGARELELEDEGEAGGVGEAGAEFVAQDAQRAVPREDLRRAGLAQEGGEVGEDALLRRREELGDGALPGAGGGGRHGMGTRSG